MAPPFSEDRRVCIYPNYIDSRKTVAEGRRVAKEKACEAPNALEILDCVTNGLKLEAEAEMKCYPRDWMVPGRVRVKLRNDDGSPVNPDVPDRKTLLVRVAELVPRHPGRINGKPAPPKQQPAVAAAAAASSSGSGAGPSKQQQQGGSKKKGKKK